MRPGFHPSPWYLAIRELIKAAGKCRKTRIENTLVLIRVYRWLNFFSAPTQTLRCNALSEEIKKPVSKARLAANRANAQKSTGPRTPAGKARSAANACQHGFAGSNFATVRLEDPFELDRLKADLVATYQPINSQEMWAVECMALAQNSFLRSYRLESGLSTASLNESLDPRADRSLITMTPDMIGGNGTASGPVAATITRAQNRNYAFAAGFQTSTRKNNAWPLLLRYQAQAERLYRRAQEDLTRLRAMRDELAIEQTTCEQAPAEPSPLCAPSELNPFAFYPPDHPTKPNQPIPNEPNASQPVETKPASSPAPAAEAINQFPPGK
jgi:hypothetical protein